MDFRIQHLFRLIIISSLIVKKNKLSEIYELAHVYLMKNWYVHLRLNVTKESHFVSD